MRIYRPAVVEGAEWITLQQSDPDVWESLFSLSGPAGTRWHSPSMSFIRASEDGAGRNYSDFPWLLHNVLVLRERIMAGLRPTLMEYGEFLPLTCEEPVWLYNVTSIVDALDEERSTIVRFDDGGILNIERHVFKPDAIGELQIFSLPRRASDIYLREPVVKRIGELGCVGVAFDLVWSDEPVPPDAMRIEYAAANGAG